MLETKHAFERIGISMKSPVGAFQDVTARISGSSNPCKAAAKLLHDLAGIERTFTNPVIARMSVAKLAELIVNANHHIADIDDLFDQAAARADKFYNDPKNSWMWAEAETPTTAGGEVRAVVEGLDTKVEVKADGSIKKGGKQVLVAEMYKKNVLEATTPMTNQQFVALVMKDLNMSKAGATTYAYNAKKALGEPEGGIVKAKKGRQAKE